MALFDAGVGVSIAFNSVVDGISNFVDCVVSHPAVFYGLHYGCCYFLCHSLLLIRLDFIGVFSWIQDNSISLFL